LLVNIVIVIYRPFVLVDIGSSSGAYYNVESLNESVMLHFLCSTLLL